MRTSPIGGVARPMRTHLLVLGGSWERAELALGAPAAATIAATLRLGDQIAVGGGHLAHGLQHFCEAESLAGVWAKEERSAVMETVPAPGTTRELQTAGTAVRWDTWACSR